MTKTFLWGLALLATTLLWTGCSNDESIMDSTPKENQAISFRVQGGMPTLRATGTTIDHMNAFVVYGGDDVSALSGMNIFDGVTVARQVGSGNVFDYNPKKYYSVNATTAEFGAYSPVSKNVSNPYFEYGAATSMSFDYEVRPPGSSGIGNTAQEDLLVAGTTVTPSFSTVQLDFRHALSRIFVRAANELNETVVIKGLTLKNLNSTGTLSGSNSTTPWTWTWSDNASLMDYPYILAATGVAVPGGLTNPILVTSNEQGMMVLPQATVNSTNDYTTGDFALEVTYDIANLTNQTTYVMLPDAYKFEMGNQYVITITFNGSSANLIEINFNVSVSDFEPIIES